MATTDNITNEFENVETLASLPTSPFQLLQQTTKRFPEKTALCFLFHAYNNKSSLCLNYQQLLQRIIQTANALHALPVQPGEVVSILLPNLPQTCFALWGAQIVGIANPINPALESAQIQALLNTAKTKVLITLAPFPGNSLWHKVQNIRSQVPTLQTILTVDLAQLAPWWQKITVRGLRKIGITKLPREPNIHDFDTFIKPFSTETLAIKRPLQPSDPIAYFHTDGTTGTPKLVVHTAINEIISAYTVAKCLTLTEHDRLLCGLPFTHVSGAIMTMLMPFCVGASIVLASPEGFWGTAVIPNFWRLINRFTITTFFALPTTYSELLKYPVNASIQSLKYGICTGAPLPIGLFKTFEHCTGVKILESYGLTESAGVCTLTPPEGEKRIGSVGIKLPFQQLNIVQLDATGQYLRHCQTNEIGTVIIKGANISPHYHQETPDHSAWLAEGWFNTGDLGRLDSKGYLWLSGTQKDLIHYRGQQIDAHTIEEVFYQNRAVESAAVVAKPDVQEGEIPIIYVTLRREMTAEALIKFAQLYISDPSFIPKSIIILDKMPLTILGKINKSILRKTNPASENGV